MIEVGNLSKRYGTKLAVDGLNFVVQPGIVAGFLGTNGSGKSTTMRMIAGLDQPTTGGSPSTAVTTGPRPPRWPNSGCCSKSRQSTPAGRPETTSLSSHLMSEMAQTATRLVVIGRGHLIADTTVDEFVARASNHSVTVRTPEAARLRELLVGPDVTVTNQQPDVLGVDGLTAEHIGTIAWQNQIPIFELTVQQASLEEAFMALTNDSVEYRSTDATASTDTAGVTS